VVRNVLGMTGIGLICCLVTGALIAWIGPLAFTVIAQYAVIANYSEPLTWPARSPTDRGGWIAAMAAFTIGLIAFTKRGPRIRPSGELCSCSGLALRRGKGCTVPDLWADQTFLRDVQYKTDANLAARQSVYAYQHPRIDLTARVLDLAGLPPAGVVADIGCGNGRYLAELSRRGVRGHLIGVDLSPGMLAAARSQAPAATLIVADASGLPLRDGTAALTLAMHMLYHVPDPAAAVRELRRVTQPGGTVVVALNAAGHMREIREVVMEAGLGYPRERVTLDDGEALLRTVFTSVTRHDFPAQLRIPDPEPVADYVRSLSETRSSADPEAVVSKITARMFPNGGGHPVTITTHAGCLICS
jgi:SAM-dependent methyltransferase